MKTEFMVAITQLSAEKNLSKEVVLAAVESALISAYRKNSFALNQDISVKINPNTGGVKVYVKKTVVENPTDPPTELSLAEAQKEYEDLINRMNQQPSATNLEYQIALMEVDILTAQLQALQDKLVPLYDQIINTD